MRSDDEHFYRFLESRFRPVIEHLVFVIMPFTKALDKRYSFIKSVLENVGWSVRRADEIYGTSELIGNVIRSLQEAHVVIADLTGRNPNVLYELGLANGFGKDVLLIASHEDDIPVDLKHLTYFVINEDNSLDSSNLLLNSIDEMARKPSGYTPITQVQRVMMYSDVLGIEDIIPANEKFAFDFIISAKKSIDIVFISARTLSSGTAQNVTSDLTDQFRRLRTRVLMVHPKNEYCESYYDIVDGTGPGNCAAQVHIGYLRLKSLGIEPRFHMDLLPWGGVIIDDDRAAIQFVYPNEWQTYFVLLKNSRGGLMHAFRAKYEQLYSK